MATLVQQLRRKPTVAERQLWQALRAGRFAGFKFRRQYSKGPYYLDLYCPLARVSVELDGDSHGYPRQQAHDQARSEWLARQGIREVRFWNSEWKRNREGILLKIWQTLHEETGIGRVERKPETLRYIPPVG